MGIQDILKLPTAERILIVEQIWDSLDHQAIELTSAQTRELDRRKRLDDAGQMKWHTWEDVKASLKAER